MKRHLVGLLLTTSALALPGHCVAAETDQDGATAKNEIIVTAQKRAERLSDVPLSITAATGDQLARQNVTSPTDLERVVPGFAYQKSSFGVPVFTIRGIGLYDTFIGVSPTVTVYVDQVPLPYLAMSAGAGLDIERVEVLKGPQGTLFGQNSTGGAINYIAAKPTQDLKAGVDLTYGRFNELDGQAFLSGPISNTLRARVAVRHESRDAWQVSETRPNDRLGKRDFTAARLLLDWEPTDRLKFELNANGWWDNSDTQAAQFVEFAQSVPGGFPASSIVLGGRSSAPKDPRIADWDENANLKKDDRLYQVSLRGDYEVADHATLTSITAYSDFKAWDPTDVDGTDFDNFLMTVDASIQSFSQELRLAGDFGAIKYTIGGNYQNDVVDDADRLHYNGSNSGTITPMGPVQWFDIANLAYQHIKTAAVFGNLEYEFVTGLTAQAAIRYTDQHRRFRGCVADGGDGAAAAGLFVPIPGNTMAQPGECLTWTSSTNPTRLPDGVHDKLNENNVSWRLGLNWKPAPDALLYVNVTKGYKSGSFTPLPAVVAEQLAPVTQESVLAYEVGFKTTFLANRLQLSGAAFYYDYKNKQIQGYKVIQPFGQLPANLNIPKGKVEGFELEATLRPLTGLRVTSGLSYVHSKVDGAFSGFDPYGQMIDLNGEAFPSTPKWQFLTDAQYDFPLTGALNAYFGGSVTARSSTYAAFGERPNFKIDGYALVDLRAGVETADGHWRAQVWGKNVGNTFYVINVSHLVDTVPRTAGMGATYGISLSYRY